MGYFRISFAEMRSSNLINYLTNMCLSDQGTTRIYFLTKIKSL